MPRRNAPVQRSTGQRTGGQRTGGQRTGGQRTGAARPAVSGSPLGQRTEPWLGVDYLVRPVAGSGSGAPYRCPGCDQQVAAARPHVVAWPADDIDAEDRRHWHSACWVARHSRQPGTVRSRNAPRYG